MSERVKFTHLDKIFFPRDGFTKGDLIDYYRRIAPAILPHLRGRPVTLVRFPDGMKGQSFFEKNAPAFTPDWVRTFEVPRRRHEGAIRYILIEDADTLAWCANLAAIELHPFLHRAPKLDQPTAVAFDLDPGRGRDVLACRELALLLKEMLEGLGLQAFPKVSGSKGLQVYVPLNRPASYEETGAFANAVAVLLERQHPDLVVTNMAKAERTNRVFVDWSQNSGSKTTVCVYSVRAKRDEPFVSLPVGWAELKRARKAEALFFSPAEALRRVKRLGDLFAPVNELRQKLPAEFARALADSGRAARGSQREADSLRAYERKRDFSRTREPRPAPGRTKGERGGRFVIQKHAASHLHYDFRLEMDGVLKSWAVPKGLPAEPGVKRTAIEVEDHPLGYIDFEGTIPKGQYGGGTVMVWDRGTYQVVRGDYAGGSFHVRLVGKKLKGEWHLFRIRNERGKDIWLATRSGAAMKPIGPRQEDRSALSGRSMARIAADADAVWNSDRS